MSSDAQRGSSSNGDRSGDVLDEIPLGSFLGRSGARYPVRWACWIEVGEEAAGARWMESLGKGDESSATLSTEDRRHPDIPAGWALVWRAAESAQNDRFSTVADCARKEGGVKLRGARVSVVEVVMALLPAVVVVVVAAAAYCASLLWWWRGP